MASATAWSATFQRRLRLWLLPPLSAVTKRVAACGDLWLPIGLHFGWNWALPLFGANLSGYGMTVTGLLSRSNASTWWTGGYYGPEGGVFTTAVVIALFLFLHFAPIDRQASALAGLPKDLES